MIEGADAGTDLSLTLEMLHEAINAAVDMADRETLVELGRRAAELPARTVRDEFSQAVVLAFAAMFAGGYERVRARLSYATRAVESAAQAGTAQPS